MGPSSSRQVLGERSTSLADRSAHQLARLVRRRLISASEVADAFLKRIARSAAVLNCFVTVLSDTALEDARRLDADASRGHWRGPLHGVPVTLKDNIATGGTRTSAGSKILSDWVPDSDAELVRRLRRAGAVILAKDSLFAFASGGPDPAYGHVRHPADPRYYSGGSSSGSAVAVASGLSCLSFGTDSGGSIRIPSAFCGVIGLKATTGQIPMDGIIPVSYSLDCVGPIARSIADIRLALRSVAQRPPPARPQSLKGVRVGVFPHGIETETHPDVWQAVEGAVARLVAAGAVVRSAPSLDLRLAQSVKNVIFAAEASEYHSLWYPERRGDYHTEGRHLLDSGWSLAARHYVRAMRVRAALRESIEQAFGKIDLLVGPTVPMPPLELAQVTGLPPGDSTLSAISRWTSVYSIANLPAASVPAGHDARGLPLAVQIAAAPYAEGLLLSAAEAATWA